MAGERILLNGTVCFIDYADGEGQAVVNGRVWRWEFHEYCGPTFLRADGEPRKCQCPTVKAVWRAFEKWHRRYGKAKKVPKNRREMEEVLVGQVRSSEQRDAALTEPSAPPTDGQS